MFVNIRSGEISNLISQTYLALDRVELIILTLLFRRKFIWNFSQLFKEFHLLQNVPYKFFIYLNLNYGHLQVDTNLKSPDDFVLDGVPITEKTYNIAPYSSVLLEAMF